MLALTAVAGMIGLATISTPPQSEERSSQWPKVREAHLRLHPVCEACGQKDNLNVHHVIPFSFDKRLELDPSNLITLCKDGPGNLNCHLFVGHAGNYKCYNPKVREDAKRLREILSHKVCKEQ